VSGKPLSFIKDNFYKLLSDSDFVDTPLIRLFTDSVSKIFEAQPMNQRLMITGTKNLLYYPEFEDLKRVRTIIELVENEDVIVHVLEKIDDLDTMNVLIGSELELDILDDYSLIRSSFKSGSASGSIGIIGPKRMNYSKMISLVSIFSKVLSDVK